MATERTAHLREGLEMLAQLTSNTLTIRQLVVLLKLHELGSCSVKELTKSLSFELTPSGATRIVQQLGSEGRSDGLGGTYGLVSYEAGEDRRQKVLRLTRKGETVVELLRSMAGA